jgi:hypothetical protein
MILFNGKALPDKHDHGTVMRQFRYQTKNNKELWICQSCKKSHSDLILLRAWKLIDRKEGDSACEFCSGSIFAPQPPADFGALP